MARPWTLEQIPDQTGKTYVVTGANSGLGLETARELLRRGAEVVLACRSPERAANARAALAAELPSARAKVMRLDLASLASVRAFAAQFRSEHEKLHGLVNNAGLMAIPFAKTEDGFEMQLGTNHLGHFALAGLLFPLLESTGAASAPARVVSVASQAHRIGTMRFDDLMGARRYDKWTAYGQSKLANLLFCFELQRRIEARWTSDAPVRATAAHPGYSATELQGKGATLGGSQLEAFVMRIGNGLLAQKAAMGAWPSLRAATDPDAPGGVYYGPSGFFELKGAPVEVSCTAKARDLESAKRLWDVSCELTGVDFGGL